MKRPTREQEKAMVNQWRQAAPVLARTHANEVRNRPYNWKQGDALLCFCLFEIDRTEMSAYILSTMKYTRSIADRNSAVGIILPAPGLSLIRGRAAMDAGIRA